MARRQTRPLAPGVPVDLAAAIQAAGSQAALARALNVTPVTVSRWISGARPLVGTALFAIRAIVAHPEDLNERKDG